MKKNVLYIILTITLFLYSTLGFSQTLELGILTTFEAYTGTGAVANGGALLTGDVGADIGIISGCVSPAFIGDIYNDDAVTEQCKVDLFRTYIHLNDLFVTYPGTHAPAFGAGESINPGVYYTGGAGSVGGVLNLDGGGDPNAYFIIKSNGALTIGAGATVNLVNGTQSCNVFWIAEGAISVAANAVVKGTLFAHIGAVSLGANVDLEGRMFSFQGAITIGADAVAIAPACVSTIPVICEADCSPAATVDVLGVLSGFALFTSVGAVANTSTTGVDGNIGTDGGAISGFGSSVVVDSFYNSDAFTIQAKIDIDNAYTMLMALPNTVTTHTPAFGSGETVDPGVYYIGAAGSLAGTITLDGQNNPDAIFVFKFAGAFTVAAASKVILINDAHPCNVFWIGGAGVATGAISIGATSVLKGTFLSHDGACSSGAGVFLEGRQLSTTGAVNTYAGIIFNNPTCVTSTSLSASSTEAVAVPDSAGSISGATGGTNVVNVLTNDSLNGTSVSITQVDLTTITLHDNLTLNADGSVDVASNIPTGTYALMYQICEKSDSTNCSSTSVTVFVSCIQSAEPSTACNETATFNTATCSWDLAVSVAFNQNILAGLSNDASSSWGVAWGDYDNDGFDDLYVAEYDMNSGSFLYHNNGDGSFTKETSGVVTSDGGSSIAGTWGDYNNDGQLDLFVANNTGAMNALYKNNGGGNFTKITTGDIANYSGYCHGASWVDYNNDGYLDLFVTDYMPTRFNLLYKNNGDETFTLITNSLIAQEAKYSIGATWADYDNDGDMDVFVPATNGESNSLYRNDGADVFTKMDNVGISADNANSVGCSWGDYDNDSDLDLFVTNTSGQNNFFYQNNGDGTFTAITSGLLVSDGGLSSSSNWIDFDNDGDLDLYVCNDQSDQNTMYINNGDGTFSKLETFLSENLGNSYSQAWSDFDNDGDLDVLVGNHSNETNVFFENSIANCNSWLCMNLTGINANRSAIGARISVKATIYGVGLWQLKEVSAQTGGGAGSQNSLKKLFGLGDATTIDSIIIKWPSGYRQELINQNINACIDLVEGDGIQVCGVVYHDENQNCIQDAEEIGLSGILMKVEPGNRFTTTDANGEYQFFLEAGTYSLSQELSANWTVNCNVSGYSLVIVEGITYCENNFGNSTTCSDPNLNVTLGTTVLRKGFQNTYSVIYGNAGVFDAVDVELSLEVHEDIVFLSSSSPWSSSVQNDTLVTYTWLIDTVKAITNYDISIIDSISVNTTIGKELTVTADITNNDSDCDISDNTFMDVNPVVGAVDPNDLTVYPVGDGYEGYIEKTQELRYKIRFQNVGTYFAQNVKITNTLTEELDVRSINSVLSSHAYVMRRDGQNLQFIYTNIFLPDSSENQEGSNGFVEFKISPKEGIKNGEIIPNKASIVFDFEDPLATNRVQNTIKSSKDGVYNKLVIHPNPVQKLTTIVLELSKAKYMDYETISTIEVYDIIGKKIRYVNYTVGEQSIQLDVSRLQSGVYLVKVINQNGEHFSGKLIKD